MANIVKFCRNAKRKRIVLILSNFQILRSATMQNVESLRRWNTGGCELGGGSLFSISWKFTIFVGSSFVKY